MLRRLSWRYVGRLPKRMRAASRRTTMEAMLLSLHIAKVEPGLYRTRVMHGREEVGEYESINVSSAIREAAHHRIPDLSGYHVWYEHVCAGTCATSNMRIDPRAWPSG